MTASEALRALILVVSLGAIVSSAEAQLVEDRTQDKVAFPAHKIMGNLYYVGTGTLNSYLITTPAGHILINANFEDTVPLLRASIEKLGFKLADIKILLGSHAHGDHMQADAMVKEITGGATVMAMEQDVPALKNMTPGNKPHPIDRVLKDGEQVALGGATLTAHWTPGHTRGCTTWAMKAQDGGRAYDVVIACGGLQDGARLVNNKNYPEIADDFARSIKKYRTLPVDVFLASHSWFFDLAGKHAKLGGASNPYIDPAGYKRFVDNMESELTMMLAEQRKNPPVVAVPAASAAQGSAAIEQGKKIYTANRCQICHSVGGQGNKRGALDGVGKKLSVDDIRSWIVDAESMTAKTKAPRKPLMKSYLNIAKADLDALIAYMQSLK